MPIPVLPSGQRDIDGVLWGSKWDTPHLTYAFPSAKSAYVYAAGISGFEIFNASQQSAATRALDNAAAVSGLSFTKVASAGAIRFGEALSVDYLDGMYGAHPPGFNAAYPSAEGNPPDPQFAPHVQGHIWFSKQNYNAPQIGTFSYAAGILHELGHALGLKHGQSSATNNGVTYPALPPDHDSQEYSVMTYNTYPHHRVTDPFALDYPTTFMQNDIAALQYMYGADYTHNAGATVYVWSPSTGEVFINGAGQGRPAHNKIFSTVWDGGGIDTFNFANYATPVFIDLAPGAWTTPSTDQLAYLGDGHYARGSIATARLFQGDPRGLIENAAGGSGGDIINGNSAGNLLRGYAGNDVISGGAGNDRIISDGGNDTLNGGAGHDYLTGGDGRDTFVFAAALDGSANADRISDFKPGVDLIKLDNAVYAALGETGPLAPGNFQTGSFATARTVHVLYDPGTGRLTYDVNGSAAGGQTLIALLSKHLPVTHADFIVV